MTELNSSFMQWNQPKEIYLSVQAAPTTEPEFKILATSFLRAV